MMPAAEHLMHKLGVPTWPMYYKSGLHKGTLALHVIALLGAVRHVCVR